MSDVVAFGPGWIEELASWRTALERVMTVQETNDLRSAASAVLTWAWKRGESKELILELTGLIRSAERKLGILVTELKARGEVQAAGRPRTGESRLPSVREMFGDYPTQSAAYLFAGLDDAQWSEILERARAAGDMTRRALREMISGPRPARPRIPGGGPPGYPVTNAINALRAAIDALELLGADRIYNAGCTAAIRREAKRLGPLLKG